jgi:hypothetical protein
MKDQDPDLMDRLRALPVPPQDSLAHARGLRRARARLQQHQPGGAAGILDRAWRLYLRAEPVVVTSMAVIYLGWAWEALTSLWR